MGEIPVAVEAELARLRAVRGGWRKGVRHEDRNYLPLTAAVLAAHLKGEAHIGLYPLLGGDRCWWLAADFDGPEAMFDALMSVKAGRALQVPVALAQDEDRVLSVKQQVRPMHRVFGAAQA